MVDDIPEYDYDISGREIDFKLTIDKFDQRLIELLLKGYTNKKIALYSKSPLSTIQRRIRRIFDNSYIIRKNELNYKKLGLRKVYLMISLKGDFSAPIAQKISHIRGITFVSLVTGGIDILCTCIFRDTDELFKIIEKIRAIDRVDNVTASEEVSIIPAEETLLNVEQTEVDLHDNDINATSSGKRETIT